MDYSVKDVFFEDGFLYIYWKNGQKNKYPYRFLRLHCPCAGCIDEWSGEKILDEKTIPANIFPKKSNYIGNYALQIEWSDGHNTGIYTWKKLYYLQ